MEGQVTHGPFNQAAKQYWVMSKSVIFVHFLDAGHSIFSRVSTRRRSRRLAPTRMRKFHFLWHKVRSNIFLSSVRPDLLSTLGT